MFSGAGGWACVSVSLRPSFVGKGTPAFWLVSCACVRVLLNVKVGRVCVCVPERESVCVCRARVR